VQTRRRIISAGGTFLLLARAHANSDISQQPPRQAEQVSEDHVATPLGPVDVVAKWAYIMDHNTGAELLDKHASEPMPPSSMAKLMTLYISYKRLQEGRLALDQPLPVSERAWRMGGSRMFVDIDSKVPVEALIRGVVVQSGNDASLVLAEAIGGSEAGFVDLMNNEAKRLGMTATVFRNCTGWPDPDQRTSCRDIASLAHHIILEFPQYYRYESEKSFSYNNIEQYNRNPLVQKGLADGLKTGHTEAGGYGLCASAQRDGQRIIMVLNGLSSSATRAEESKRLLEWSFREFDDITIFAAHDAIDHAPVWLGAQRTVPMVTSDDVIVTCPRELRDQLQVSIAYEAPVAAPIAAGDDIGRMTISVKGMAPRTVSLVAGADVDRLSLTGRGIAVLSNYIESVLSRSWQ
jgi:serine-type D-Ala-D-Ala carboxypeptidase (penicillin-binding protein 5/6)